MTDKLPEVNIELGPADAIISGKKLAAIEYTAEELSVYPGHYRGFKRTPIIAQVASMVGSRLYLNYVFVMRISPEIEGYYIDCYLATANACIAQIINLRDGSLKVNTRYPNGREVAMNVDDNDAILPTKCLSILVGLAKAYDIKAMRKSTIEAGYPPAPLDPKAGELIETFH